MYIATLLSAYLLGATLCWHLLVNKPLQYRRHERRLAVQSLLIMLGFAWMLVPLHVFGQMRKLHGAGQMSRAKPANARANRFRGCAPAPS